MLSRYTLQLRLRASAWLGHWPGARLRSGLVSLCLLGLMLWATAGLAQAHQAPASKPHPLAANLTQDLVALSTRHQLADPAEQAQLLRTLITVGTERQQLLAALVADDPGEVVRVALPADLRASLPPAVQALVEEELEVEGKLEILHEDRDVGSRYLYALQTTGGRFALHFAADPPTHLETGARVRVTGVQVAQTLALSSSTTSVQTLAAALPNTFGAQKTLVMLVNFSDKTTQPYTVATAQSVVFTTTSNFDLENSYGQTWLTGAVVGWYTIPLSSTTCNSSSIATYAKQAATAAGSICPSTPAMSMPFPITPAPGGVWGPSAATPRRPGSTAAWRSRSSATRWGITSASTTRTRSNAAPPRWGAVAPRTIMATR